MKKTLENALAFVQGFEDDDAQNVQELLTQLREAIKKPPVIVIEVRGGNIVETHANTDMQVIIVDYDIAPQARVWSTEPHELADVTARFEDAGIAESINFLLP